MDIKSKNIKDENIETDEKTRKSEFGGKESYEDMVKDFKKMKFTRTVLIIFLTVSLAMSLIAGNDFWQNRGLFNNNSLYSWSFLGDDIDTFTKKVLAFGEFYKTEDYVKDPNNISQEEMDIAREWVDRKIDSEYTSKTDKLYEKDTSEWSEQRWQQEQEQIKEQIKSEYGYDDESLKNMIVEKKLINYKKYKNSLDGQLNLKYIIYDKGNNLWLSNIEPSQEGIEKLRSYGGYFAEHHIVGDNTQSSIYINGKKVSVKELEKSNIHYYDSRYGYNYLSVETTIENDYYGGHETRNLSINGDLDIYISVPDSLTFGDSIYTGMEDYVRAEKMAIVQMWSFIISFVAAVILIIILKKMKYKGSYFEIIVNKLKEVPIEFTSVGLIVILIVRSMFFWWNWGANYRYTIYPRNIIGWIVAFLGIYIFFKVLMYKYKNKELLKGSYLVQFYENVQICLEKKSFGKKLFSILAIYVVGLLLGGFLLILGFGEAGLIIAICGAIGATILFVFTTTRDLAYLNKITKGAKDICEGRTSQDIPEKRKGALRDLAHSINNMKEGLKTSIENETKSERMKTELITNVSHDLKTPLTSIINYVDLLKRADIQPEEAKAYVAVLDKKSQRLKILIEDLFEASKAASGSMQLTLTRVEVVALLRQTLGEAEGRIEKANLDFKVTAPKEKIYISADGRKIWRVFENLISNIIKYSLPGTRVYINVKEENDRVYITMKNISSYELNFDPEEITERFKRGEESRHTEGSGLGLAIAKNIVGLHGGEMLIDIDGDLFKSTVIFDVNKEKPKSPNNI